MVLKMRKWYRKPKTEYLCEYIFVGQDGKPINLLVEESAKGPTEETKRLITTLIENGFKFIHSKSFMEEFTGIKTKEEQEHDIFDTHLTEWIFKGCGAEQYL